MVASRGLETLFTIWLALLGLSIGSFLNVVIARLPEGLSVVSPRSRCPKCGHQLPWYENIPVLSWLMLRGRCSGCKTPISPRYVLVELLTGTLFVASLARFDWTWQLVGALTFLSVLIPLIFIDAEHWVLPFELTLPGIALGLALQTPLGLEAFLTGLIGAVAGFLVFRLLEFLGWLAVGREAMGGGDKYLMAMAGATLGWRALFAIVLLSSLQGALYGIARMLLTGRAGPMTGGEAAERDEPEVPRSERAAGLLAHLGALVSSIIAPLAVTLTAGRRSKWVKEQAIEALNFQLTFGLLALAPLTLNFVLERSGAAMPPETLLLLEGAIGLAWVGLTLLGAMRVWTGERYLYPLTLRLIPGPELDEDHAGGEEEEDEAPAREPFTPAFLEASKPLWKRLLLIPWTLFLQDIPDPPPPEEDTGEEPEWVPGASNLPFGPWIGLAAVEVLLLGPSLAAWLAHTPFNLIAELSLRAS